jgi:mono/diheme cytochrome c family protein
MSIRRVLQGLKLTLGCMLLLAACDGVAADGDPEAELASEMAEVPPEAMEVLPEGVTREMVVEGRELYVVCSVCHGMEGEGTQLGPPLRDGEWRRIEGDLVSIEGVVREGVRSPADYPVPMPVMGGGSFTAEELRAVSAYVYALGQGVS